MGDPIPGKSGTHQRELAWHQLVHRDNQHHHAPQGPSAARTPLHPHEPAGDARGLVTINLPALDN